MQNISSMSEEGTEEERHFSLMLFLYLPLPQSFQSFGFAIYLSIEHLLHTIHSPAMPHLVLIATLCTIIIHSHFIGGENETPNRLSNLPISEAATWQRSVSYS